MSTEYGADQIQILEGLEAIKSAGDKPYVVGKIENGEKGVTLC